MDSQKQQEAPPPSGAIPFLDFTGGSDPLALEQGSDAWNRLCGEVRGALESAGCFRVAYGTAIPATLRASMFAAMKLLFDLPAEDKEKHIGDPSEYTYQQYPSPTQTAEAFGFLNSTLVAAPVFADLTSADSGADADSGANSDVEFRQIIKAMSTKMRELNMIITRMIFDSYGAGKYYDSYFQNAESSLRVMKYRVLQPPASRGGDSTPPPAELVPHIDPNWLTIICQDGAEHRVLQVLSEEGDFVPVELPEGSFMVFAGHCFEGWSNGRVRAVEHRVVMGGGCQERFSFGSFLAADGGVVIQAPPELVDEEHPRVFRPFMCKDFFSHYIAKTYPENILKQFAGIF